MNADAIRIILIIVGGDAEKLLVGIKQEGLPRSTNALKSTPLNNCVV